MLKVKPCQCLTERMYIFCKKRYLGIRRQEDQMAEPARTWQIKDARANFSTLVDKAISDGPQIVTAMERRPLSSSR
jgi:hypothetical protein